MPGGTARGGSRVPRVKARITAPKSKVKDAIPPKNAHYVHIGCCASLSMTISPGLWLADTEEFMSKFSGNPKTSLFAGLREDLLKSGFTQTSRWKLANLIFADLFDSCASFCQTGKSSLEVTFMVRSSSALASFPGNSQDLLKSVSDMSLWKPKPTGSPEDTKFSMEAFTKTALSKVTLSQKIDSVLYVFDVDSVYWNLAEIKNCIAELVKLIPCHFILFDEPIATHRSRMVVHMLTNVIVNTVSQLTICRSPVDCVGLSTTLARNLLRRKSKGCTTIQRPNATDFHLGCIRPAQVLARLLDSVEGEYVKPAGAESIEVFGFLDSEDQYLNGFGFKRRYQILNAYEESCYKKCVEQYDPKAVSHTDSVMKLIMDSLDHSQYMAFCRLKKGKTAAEPSYGIVFPHPEERSVLLFGLLPKELGAETWTDRLTWVSAPFEKPLPVEKRTPISPALLWLNHSSMDFTTSNVLGRLITNNNVPEFNKFVDDLLDHAAVIGHNPMWLVDLLKSQQIRARSKDMSVAILKWMSELRQQ